MKIPPDNVVALLQSPHLEYVENLIAEAMNTRVDREHQSVIVRMVQQELEDASLACDDVLKILEDNAEDVFHLAVAMLRDESLSRQKADIPGLAWGCGVNFGIYLSYAQRENFDGLIEYLRRRRIPRASLFANRVIAIYGEIKKKSNGRRLGAENESS